ncbi:hypothetical protein MHL31_12000 [Lutibacter sp. A80]|uniref:hypothetical protein n=1 Tax=Lutibacter sp. A80 TaxID=2918453 RepID=UPI001F06B75A|nr:hypothetical protein [Lutibacter sp. A80]UMB59797.1 hypothetical protein MHL31_12000 [Lutibacter sp. A80]
MNKIVYLFISVIFIVVFKSCGLSNSTSNFEQHPSFIINSAFYKNLDSRQPGVKGYIFQVDINNSNTVLDSVYFRNASAKLEKDTTTSKNSYVGTLMLPNRMQDFILHSDSKKEFGNKLPEISKKSPFQLTENEAVISFTVNNEIKYYKIPEVKKLEK